jgi:uncharacterized protein (TIGR02996 family)
MTHDDAFLRDVLDHPDDDAPRLIYADWLEEHGYAARAEFIRVQCELAARGPARSREELQARRALGARKEALLERHGAAWAAPLCGLAGEWTFRRGFVEEVAADAHALVGGADTLFRLAPLRHLRLYWAGDTPHERARFMPAVAGCAQLSRLCSLDLSNNYLQSDGARALAASEHLAGLTTLDLSGNHVGDGGARALAAAPWLGGVIDLRLGGNDVGPAGARALAEGLDRLEAAGHLRLRSLDLRGNRLGDAGLRAVRASRALRRVARL